jgi:hypothetical protein
LKLFLRAAMRQHEALEERVAKMEQRVEEIRARKES